MKPFSQGIHRYFICIFLIIFGCPNGFANKENRKKEKGKKRETVDPTGPTHQAVRPSRRTRPARLHLPSLPPDGGPLPSGHPQPPTPSPRTHPAPTSPVAPPRPISSTSPTSPSAEPLPLMPPPPVHFPLLPHPYATRLPHNRSPKKLAAAPPPFAVEPRLEPRQAQTRPPTEARRRTSSTTSRP
jgi:hypothetical protein